MHGQQNIKKMPEFVIRRKRNA